MSERPTTLGALKESGYRPLPVKSEMRHNLVSALKENRSIFPGILGYEDTVFPQIQNAILSKHDMLFLGLRGQGKTRMLRMLVNLLDEYLPIVRGSEINDDPLQPLSKYARDLIAEHGDETPIEWLHREERYHEKLATPDVTIADLIGEVDLIKHAEGRHLASEDVMHFGLIPRSHRGLFCMNELPDLSPKIQVGLFNVLEERDIQIRGFTVRLPLDLCLVFSANPEDYTNRGRLVTPLKDRIGSVIRTHYPESRELGMEIVQKNAWLDRESEVDVFVPTFLREALEETVRLARKSPHVNQASGVSVRMSIANYENLVSNVERRALRTGEENPIARPSDLTFLTASARGKMELTMSEEPGEEDRLMNRLMGEALKTIFDEWLKPKQYRNVLDHFETGGTIEIGNHTLSAEIVSQVEKIKGFRDQLEALIPDLTGQREGEQGVTDAMLASVAEFVLEGLHTNNRVNKTPKDNQTRYGM